MCVQTARFFPRNTSLQSADTRDVTQPNSAIESVTRVQMKRAVPNSIFTWRASKSHARPSIMTTPTPLQQARNAHDRALRALIRAEREAYLARPNNPQARAAARAAARTDRDRANVLDLLTRLGPLPRRSIAEALGITLPAVDRAVQALVRARRVVVDGAEVRARRPRTARHNPCNDPK